MGVGVREGRMDYVGRGSILSTLSQRYRDKLLEITVS